jgi:hypothetical protein
MEPAEKLGPVPLARAAAVAPSAEIPSSNAGAVPRASDRAPAPSTVAEAIGVAAAAIAIATAATAASVLPAEIAGALPAADERPLGRFVTVTSSPPSNELIRISDIDRLDRFTAC